MTPAEEATFIQLWQQGAIYTVIARALGIPGGTVGSRATRLVKQGKIQPRPRGGSYPKQHAVARPEGTPATPVPPVAPVPPAAERQDIQQWTVRLSKALIDHIKAVAYERRIPPSRLVEELVWKALTDHHPSAP